MSIAPINPNAQTQLVPNSLLGYSSDGVSAIEILPTSITIAGNLTTTPIYVGISASTGLTTTLATGLDVNCDFNMNGNDITNLNSITNNSSGLNITGFGGDININAGGDLNLSADGNVNITATTTIYEDAVNVNIRNTINTDARINLDLSTTYPVIELFDGNGNSYTTTYNEDLTISANNSSNYTTEKTLTIKSFNDNVYLTAPSGKTYINKNGVGDGEIVAVNFVGNLSGNANSASTATTATTANSASTASVASLATTITTTNTNANLSHYLNFSDSSSTGNGSVQKTAGLSCNPSTNSITATSFVGNLSGTSSSASAITLLTDNTSGTYYIPFSKNVAGSQRTLYVDDTTGPLSYNPSTSTLTASIFSGSCSTTGLVFLQTLTGTITGAVLATTFTLPSIFNTTYKNYRIHLTFGENSFTAYPSVSLNGYSGANVPTSADIYGYDMTSGALSAVSLANQTLSTTPVQLTGACLPNCQLEFDVFNVGYTTLQSNNIIRIVCNSTYNNPGVKGIRNITATTNQNSSSTVTGLSLQSIMGLGNNPTWTAKIYGYK